LGKPAGVGKGRSEPCEDEVGEDIDVEDWQEELGGGQTEPMRSQVRVQWDGETQTLKGGLSLARRT
jgi:hypothetical protein